MLCQATRWLWVESVRSSMQAFFLSFLFQLKAIPGSETSSHFRSLLHLEFRDSIARGWWICAL